MSGLVLCSKNAAVILTEFNFLNAHIDGFTMTGIDAKSMAATCFSASPETVSINHVIETKVLNNLLNLDHDILENMETCFFILVIYPYI